MNKVSLRLGLITAATLFTAACAHHPDVRAGADGVHRVVIASEDTEQGSREAIRQANSFCKERNQTAAFINENSQYKGDYDEKTYKTAKKASKAAQVLGSATYVLGGQTESTAGGIVGLGGAVADGVLGNGYNVEMKFKCM
ncbi:hypothetical protein AB1A81_10255 [Bdellovibrio bacteriovorus]|uniref:Lipoprotein n=1 Tax=Bdellovibrio bacteriovorus (strain ATCC 15356 / DSM 50701 / NCIMB 9529 / HD100) TaxID=264462 RepID=Q6MKY7_BDEBA|nr:hypothetical protein [Bdellovibrio bacteriovorus]CAE80070.1 hypothetical protein predicted by Glimmer/Critica [Bdellovibrio bacteriovorus HD100]